MRLLSAGSGARHIGHRGVISRYFHPVWGDGAGLAARWNGGTAASGGRMSQTVGWQETLRRLAMIDEGFVEDQAGLGLGLARTPVLHPKTAALLQLGASVATGAPPVCVEWSTGRALAAGATDEEIAGALLAIAPVTGLGRVVCAAPHVATALGYDLEAALDDPG
jgi:alkylhydroperoxidase/carboxymuconolactone decarboxylase family protein YurZ